MEALIAAIVSALVKVIIDYVENRVARNAAAHQMARLDSEKIRKDLDDRFQRAAGAYAHSLPRNDRRPHTKRLVR